MDNKTEKQVRQRQQLAKSWFWIALLPFLNMYCNTGATIGYFEMAAGLHDPWIYSLGFVLAGACLFLAPLLCQRLGVLDDSRRFRLVYTLAAFVGIGAMVLFAVIFTVNPQAPLWLAFPLMYIAQMAPAACAGCALYRAVKVISGPSAALFSGFTVILMHVLAIVLALLFDAFSAPAQMAVYFSLVYIALLLIPTILLLVNKDRFAYIAPRNTAYFSESLYGKFLIAAVLMMLMEASSQENYYLGGDYDSASAFLLLANLFLPVVSACVVTFLLRKNKWLAVMAGCVLLICFAQGLILFFDSTVQLATMYSVVYTLAGNGPTIFLLFIPLVFCVQRRAGAAGATGMVALYLLLSAFTLLFMPRLWRGMSPFMTPAITFALSLAATAWLFYLYSENSRVHTAGLVAAFKNRELTQISQTVSRADQLENFGLTPREKEVCALLLKSLTVRQIAGELGLAFATVNGYYRSLYKKLGVNSKAELFLRFGAEPAVSSK